MHRSWDSFRRQISWQQFDFDHHAIAQHDALTGKKQYDTPAGGELALWFTIALYQLVARETDER